MQSLFYPCVCVCVSFLLSVSPSPVITDNLVVAFQMAGHDSEVHFPEL